MISAKTAAKINWSSFDWHNLDRVLVGPDDGVYVHPALTDAWREFSR